MWNSQCKVTVCKGIQVAWNLHGGAVFCTQVSLPLHQPWPSTNIQGESGSQAWGHSGAKAREFQGKAGHKPLKARKPKPIRFSTQDSKRWQSLMAQSPSKAGKWPENLIGRNLIETVRKVKAEELTTPTGLEKGQCELSSCSIWCQRPWRLSSTARQFRPHRWAPPRKAKSSALKGDLLVSSRVLFPVDKTVS